MKTFIFAIMCSLLFVVPSVAVYGLSYEGTSVAGGIESLYPESAAKVANIVAISNYTEVDYGYVGIQCIKTTIEGEDLDRCTVREILEYNARGHVLKYRETVYEFGEVVSSYVVVASITVIDPIADIRIPPWMQRLGPDGIYSTIVFTNWAGYDATYTVGVRVTKLQCVPRRIIGPRGRRIIIPAYYRPLPEQAVATVENRFIFNLRSVKELLPVTIPRLHATN